jgi:hypothetical protein
MAELAELKGACPWVKVGPTSFRFDVIAPGRIEQWRVRVEKKTWHVRCDEDERKFADETSARGYFWERFISPPSN